MSKPKRNSIPRRLWRAVRSIYYWPGLTLAHLVRLAASYRSDNWYRITAPWIYNHGYPSEVRRKPRPPGWYHFKHRFTFEHEHMRLNLCHAKRAADVKGLALMFALGAGDYFYLAPMIAELKARYPEWPIIAYATDNAGDVNSSLIGEMLRFDPNINEVRLFNGRQTRRFKNYDYSDALRQAPPGYLAIPVFGEHLAENRHRVASQWETFGLALPNTVPLPLVHLPPLPRPHVLKLLERIKQQCARQGARGVAFLQVDSRSSHFTYPYADELARGLSERGYFVLSASKLRDAPALSHTLDFGEFAIMDSIHLLKLLQAEFADLRIVSVASVFWSVSSAFGIPNLCMQQFRDDAMHNYWYPNITVIAHRDYKNLPLPARFLAGDGDYEFDAGGKIVFESGFVLKCFDRVRNCDGNRLDTENPVQSVRSAAIS